MDYNFPTDEALKDGLASIATAIGKLADVKALERDEATGRYKNSAIKAMVDKHKTGLIYTWRVPAGSPTALIPVSAAAKRLAATKFVAATATTPAVDPCNVEGGPWFHVSANAGADPDGAPWVVAIDSVDYGFSRIDNSKGNNVYEIAPVVWQLWEPLENGDTLWSVSYTHLRAHET